MGQREFLQLDPEDAAALRGQLLGFELASWEEAYQPYACLLYTSLIVRSVDSSLVDEWENAGAVLDAAPPDAAGAEAVVRDRRGLTVLCLLYTSRCV